MEIRRRISLKSDSYPESRCVDGVRMSGEGCVHYPGRSLVLLEEATAAERRRDGAGEVSRGHSRRGDALKA